MKRWMAMMVLLLGMLLAACGSSTGGQAGSPTQEDPLCVLHISINPQMELQINEKFLITQIRYLNEDAQKAFGDVDVIGFALFDGLFALLDRAHGEGYLPDGAQMNVSAEVHGEAGIAEDVEEQIQVAVKDLKEKRQVTVAVNYTVDIKEQESIVDNRQESSPMDPIYDEGDPGTVGEMDGTTDANGITERTSIDSDGKPVTQRFDANGRMIYQQVTYPDYVVTQIFDEAGNLREDKREFVNGDWSISRYDANGRLISSQDSQFGEKVVMNPDGTTELTLVDNEGNTVTQRINANGVMIYQQVKYPDYVLTQIFDENGILREDKTENDNGDWSLLHFDAKGNEIRSEVHESNGFYEILVMDPDGTVVSRDVFDPVVNERWENPYDYIEQSTEVDSQGKVVTCWHDGRGRLLAEETDWQDGRTCRTEYEYDDTDQLIRSMMNFSDGSTVETTYVNGHRHIVTSYDARNGSRQVMTYNEKDVVISDISDGPDDFYSHRYYDDNGVLVKWDLMDFFGRDSHRTYRPDGSYIDRVYEPEVGKTLVIEYDAAGNQISYAEE